MRPQNLKPSKAELLEMLQCDDFYFILRDKEITERDRVAIQEFKSHTLTNDEWYDFIQHCLENEIDPYKEMREIIYSTYAKVLKGRIC